MLIPIAPPACAVFLTGFMGTGKTTTGQRLALRLGLPFIDTDDLVQQSENRSIKDIFETDGEDAFRCLETKALKKAISLGPAVIGTGGGLMTREENIFLMRKAGPIICLQASPQTINERTEGRSERPLLNTDNPLVTIQSLMSQREVFYSKADYFVSTDSSERPMTLKTIGRILKSDPRTTLWIRNAVRVPVSAKGQQYLVHVGIHALQKTGKLCPPDAPGTVAVVITTISLESIYGNVVLKSLNEAGWNAQIISIPDGEGSKTLETVSRVYDKLVDFGVDSGGTLFALGGGVIGDLTGFIAATYRRGIRFAQLPTSLVAQVDASVGGKVAVDHPRGKNLIGAFYQPGAVIIDPFTLQTLPLRELRGGLAEVIKHALIADETLFEYLEEHIQDFLQLDMLAVRYVLVRNCQIKADFVKRDPFDRGDRAALNYGHTIGHAVERACEQWSLSHGEAVAIGMVAEAELGVKLGLSDADIPNRLRALLQKAGLNTHASNFDIAQAERALLQDKKIAGGQLRLPVVPQIGHVIITETIQPEQLLAILPGIRAVEAVINTETEVE